MTANIIFRYDLDAYTVDQIVPMPEGATILHVASVNDQLKMWALTNPDAPLVQRSLAVVGTGNEMQHEWAGGEHVGSAVLVGGLLVAHVFDLGVA